MNLLEKVLELSAALAKPFEGLHKVIGQQVHAYHDPVGYPTIGYGHLLNKNAWSDLTKFEVLTFLTAEQLLQKDMLYASTRALELSPILGKIEHIHRWASIADFCFNCGDGNYKVSTLRKKVNEENWQEASEQILKWDKAGGKKLRGLTLRRQAESALLILKYEEEL
jgi:lysozyme